RATPLAAMQLRPNALVNLPLKRALVQLEHVRLDAGAWVGPMTTVKRGKCRKCRQCLPWNTCLGERTWQTYVCAKGTKRSWQGIGRVETKRFGYTIKGFLGAASIELDRHR